jgi:hypothetical protein
MTVNAQSYAGSVPVFTVGSDVVNVGDTFTIAVSVSDAIDLQAFQFDLNYDSTKLNLIGFTDIGTDFETIANTGFGLTGLTGFSFTGLLSGVADSMVGVPFGSGLVGGVVLDITFQDIAAGTSALTASNVFLNFNDQGFDIFNGQVSNPSSSGGGSVPEPNTLLLAGIGILGAMALRNKKTV